MKWTMKPITWGCLRQAVRSICRH